MKYFKLFSKVTCDLAVSQNDIDARTNEFFIKETEMELDESEEDEEQEEEEENDKEEQSDYDDEQEEAIYDRQSFEVDPDDTLSNNFEKEDENVFEVGCYRTSFYDDLDDEVELSDYEDLFG